MDDRDLQSKTNEDLKEMINILRAKAIDYSNQNELIEKDIAKYKAKIREIIQKIPEIQEICTKRNEYLEKTRRSERKLLSLYTRFPGIIDTGSKHVLTSDVSSLQRQLDNAIKRKEEAEALIVNFKKDLEDLQRRKVELIHEDNMQDEMMAQREQGKSNLAKTLRKELDTAKKLYTTDIRTIDQRLVSGTTLLNDYTSRYNMSQMQYLSALNSLNTLIPTLTGDAKTLTSDLVDIQSRINDKSDKFLKWWGARRQVDFYQKRKEFLTGVLQSTEERMEESYKLIEDVHDRNSAKAKDIKEAQQMNKVITEKIKAAENREKQLVKELEALRASFVPLPKEITDALKRDRQTYQDRVNEKKSLDIDYQVLSDTSPEAARAFDRLENVKREYYSANRRLIEKKVAIEEIKKQIEQKKANKGIDQKIIMALGCLSDPRVLVTEEKNGAKIVAAGPIELLSRIIFEPANDDPIYPYSFIICAHTIKLDIQTIVKYITAAYESGDYNDTRQARLRMLLDAWHDWFKVDFQQVNSLVSLIGWTAPIVDYDLSQNVIFDDTIDVDMTLDLVYTSSPLIVAEHLAYYELDILMQMPASEFVGTSWTKPDKWVLAPNIMKMTEHFNTVTSYIVNCILTKESPQERGELISRWIEIMNASFDICCFPLIFEIYGALCSPAISRLAKSWEFVSHELKQDYLMAQSFTSPSRQFAAYMERIRKTPVTVVVPYIGPMLTNLVYTHDGNAAKKKLPGSGEEVLNFSKYRIYSTILKEIFKPWGRDIHFVLSKKIMMKVKQMPLPELIDTEAFNLSVKREP